MKKVLVLGSTFSQDLLGSQHSAIDEFNDQDNNLVYVDIVKNADVEHDLNVFPYPFKNKEFDIVFASHIIEHIHKEKFFVLMKELYRITKKGAKIIIYVPHASSIGAFTHPTHFNYFDSGSFSNICDNTSTLEKYLTGMYSLKYYKIKFPRRFFFLNWIKPHKFETWLSGIFHAHEIKFVLERK